MHDKAIWTYLVIGLTCLVSFKGFGNRRFVESLIFDPRAILSGREYHRLFTAGFLHADTTHLLFNMLSLFFFGPNIELVKGPYAFLFIYLSAIIGGNFLPLYLHRNHVYRALGASGGVCGIIFASIFLFPGGSIYIIPIPIPIPSWLYAILFLVFSAYGARRGTGNIGHDAHISGAIIGLLVTAVLYPSAIRRQPMLFFAILLISGAILAWLIQPNWRELIPRRSPRSRRRDPMFPGTYTEEQRTVDRILDKISRQGRESLTPEEEALLKRLSGRQ